MTSSSSENGRMCSPVLVYTASTCSWNCWQKLGVAKESLHTVTVNLFRRNIEVSPPAHLIQGGGVDPALVVKRKCSLKMPI